jgi:hypothetical protein
VIDAMSFGLIELSGLRASAAEPPMPTPSATAFAFWRGTPSTTYSGSLLAVIDVPPRMRTCTPPPGSPLFDVTLTPAARAVSSSLALVITPTLARSVFTVATDPVTASRRWVP